MIVSISGPTTAKLIQPLLLMGKTLTIMGLYREIAISLECNNELKMYVNNCVNPTVSYEAMNVFHHGKTGGRERGQFQADAWYAERPLEKAPPPNTSHCLYRPTGGRLLVGGVTPPALPPRSTATSGITRAPAQRRGPDVATDILAQACKIAGPAYIAN